MTNVTNTPPWDEEAEAWYRRLLDRIVREQQLREELVPLVVEALMERRREFVEWVDAEAYDPDNGPCGRWVLRRRALEEELADDAIRVWALVDAGRALVDAGRFPRLEDWLSALHRGALLWKGPSEPRARDLLSNKRPRRKRADR